MIGRHWIIQVIIVVIVFNIDFQLGSPMASLLIALLYFFGILISAVKRQWFIVNKRIAYMVLFIVVGISAAAFSDAEPTIDLHGDLQNFIDDMVYDIMPKK